MFRDKIKRLINEYGIKQEYIIRLINSNRVTFPKKINNNDFSIDEQNKIKTVYGSLIE